MIQKLFTHASTATDLYFIFYIDNKMINDYTSDANNSGVEKPQESPKVSDFIDLSIWKM